jgi:hypothetical protein
VLSECLGMMLLQAQEMLPLGGDGVGLAVQNHRRLHCVMSLRAGCEQGEGPGFGEEGLVCSATYTTTARA